MQRLLAEAWAEFGFKVEVPQVSQSVERWKIAKEETAKEEAAKEERLGREKAAKKEAAEEEITEEEAETLYLAYHRLTDPDEMGTIYRTMSMVSMPSDDTSYVPAPPAGF